MWSLFFAAARQVWEDLTIHLPAEETKLLLRQLDIQDVIGIKMMSRFVDEYARRQALLRDQ